MKFVFNRHMGIEIVAGLAAVRFNGSECTTHIDESEAKFLRDALLQAYPIPQAAPSDDDEQALRDELAMAKAKSADPHDALNRARGDLHNTRKVNDGLRKDCRMLMESAPSDAAADRIGKLAAELAEAKEEARQARNLSVSAQAELAKVRRELHTAQTTALQATEAAQALNDYNANLAERLKLANAEAHAQRVRGDGFRVMLAQAEADLKQCDTDRACFLICAAELKGSLDKLQIVADDVTRRMGNAQNAERGDQA